MATLSVIVQIILFCGVASILSYYIYQRLTSWTDLREADVSKRVGLLIAANFAFLFVVYVVAYLKGLPPEALRNALPWVIWPILLVSLYLSFRVQNARLKREIWIIGGCTLVLWLKVIELATDMTWGTLLQYQLARFGIDGALMVGFVVLLRFLRGKGRLGLKPQPKL